MEALDLAGLGDIVRAMPLGLNTVVGENVGGLSGGQQQRLLCSHRPEVWTHADRLLEIVGGNILMRSKNAQAQDTPASCITGTEIG